MRKARQIVDGAKYHIIGRINRGEFVFETAAVKDMFLDIIKRAKKKYSFTIDNFCIMDNHVHMIILPGKNESLSRIMQWILSVFAINFNNAFKLKGHVWYDRFKSIVIHSIKQLIDTFHYISNNPVVAGMVEHAAEYFYGGFAFILRGDFTIVERPPDDFCFWTAA